MSNARGYRANPINTVIEELRFKKIQVGPNPRFPLVVSSKGLYCLEAYDLKAVYTVAHA